MSLTDKAHEIISATFSKIDLGVDATCGNGNDTAFLASLCRDTGNVIGFDIQKNAIEITRKKIREIGKDNNVQLVNDGHENLQEYISDKIDVFTFNLGFLPGSDKKITSKAESTIKALNTACKYLSTPGIISVICYPGHYEGRYESEQVRFWINNIDSHVFTISEFHSESPDSSTPVLYIISR